jgi:hypothetical protein
MILAASVLDIDYRICVIPIVVSSRSIDHHRTPTLFHVGIVVNGADLSVRHILYLKVIHTLLGNLYGTCPSAGSVE